MSKNFEQNGYVAPCSKSCNFGQCVFDHGHESCECQSGYRGDDCSIKTTFTVGSIDDSGPYVYSNQNIFIPFYII